MSMLTDETDDGVAQSVVRVEQLARREAERRLRSSERKFSTAFDKSPLALTITSLADGRFVEVNEGFVRLSGYTREEALGRTPEELGLWIDPSQRTMQLKRLRAGLHVSSTEARFRVKNGEELIGLIGSALVDIDGRPSVLSSVLDVTERKRAEQALRESEERLKESDRRKDEFLAMLAHELRNPLGPVRMGLELIRLAGDTPGAVARVRTMMERQVGHMVRLIDDLLDVSRLTSGKIQLQRRPTSLAELVNSAVEANRSAFDAAHLHVTVRIPDDPCLLDVDPTRLVQVLSNLLHNALKFTPSDGHVNISATCIAPTPEGDLGQLALTVSDDGIGIAPEMLPRIFDLFTQGEHARERSEAGLGIGLALARRLIEMHGGSIDASSDGPGCGSAFTIRLPLFDHLAAIGAPSASGERVAWIARRVVIIDDNQDAAQMLAMVIEELGGKALVAHDGASGLRAVAELRPDVVLLDIGMPGMNGYDVCRRIRQESFGRDVVIVALTGWGQERDKRRALDSGFDAHLTKPADPAVLEKILAESASR